MSKALPAYFAAARPSSEMGAGPEPAEARVEEEPVRNETENAARMSPNDAETADAAEVVAEEGGGSGSGGPDDVEVLQDGPVLRNLARGMARDKRARNG